MKAKALIRQLTEAVANHYAEDLNVAIYSPDTDDAVPLGRVEADPAGNTLVLHPKDA